MKSNRGLAIALSILALGSSAAAQSRAIAPPMSATAVQATMTGMRVVGVLLDEQRRESGAYPLADGEVRPLSAVLPAGRSAVRRAGPLADAWGHPILYRANACCYLLVSLGADGRPEQDYRTAPLFPSNRAEITDAADANADLVLVSGRFVRRPFGAARAAFETINSINKIATAMMSAAIDDNRYPGSSPTFAPASELAAALVPAYLPELPTLDGWGRPILYFTTGATFGLASFGSDGKPDRVYYTDLAGGLPWNDPGPSSAEGADVVFANGHFVNWPTGVEP